MNKKYERYINHIVNNIEAPYFFNMENQYGLRPDEYEMVLRKVYNQPVTIQGRSVYDSIGKEIYLESSNGFWVKYEYDAQGDIIYYETSNGFWVKYEYDDQGNLIYYENSNGEIEDNR